MNFNKSTLVGRLVADPTFTAGDPSKNIDNRCYMRLAVNRSSAKDSPYDVFNIIAWGALADIAHKYARKGKELLVEGKLRTNNKKKVDASGNTTWENYFEVVADSIQLGNDPQGVREEQQEAKNPLEMLMSGLAAKGVNADLLGQLLTGIVEKQREQKAAPVQQDEPPMYETDFPM